jgi:hypothetical protein
MTHAACNGPTLNWSESLSSALRRHRYTSDDLKSGHLYFRRLAVATSRWILGILTLSLILLCAGCNSGSTANVQNPPPPPTQGISIAFQSTPPSSVVIGSTAAFTAVVTNDSTNAGVDWSLTCQTGGTTCGSLSAPHTPSGQAVTYTPPPTLPGNTQVVNVAGFATADHTKNILASFSVTAFGSNLSGTYVISVEGLQSGIAYQLAGAITLDGNGNVTGGQVTADMPGLGVSSETIPVGAGSTYFLGPDGRGTLTLNVSDPSISPETFSLVYLSNSRLLIAGTPNNTILLSSSGTMDLQASNITALTGGYAFIVDGTDILSGSPIAYGGILNIDGTNTISGTGSVADQNFGGTLTTGQQVNGTITPLSTGVVSVALTFPQQTLPNGVTTMTFAGYIVDQNHIKLVESDGGGSGSVSGLALGQGSSTGTFSDASFSGTYVFGALGVDMSNPVPDTLTTAAVFSADGAGHLSNGFTDTVFQALPNPQTGTTGLQLSVTFNGNYSANPNGRVSSSWGGVATPFNTFRPILDFYLGGDGTALVLVNSDVNFLYPMMAIGAVYPQSPTATLSGSYGTYFAQEVYLAPSPEFDGTAIMTSTPPSLTGVADIGPTVQAGFSGTISSQTCVPTVTGCFSGSFTGAFQAQTVNNQPILGVDFYLIDSTQGFFIENDLTQQATPQVSLGYFAASTAVQQSAAKAVKLSRK